MFFLRGLVKIDFNMQWGSVKVFLTVLRAVEMHQMHGNYLKNYKKLIFILTREVFWALFWTSKQVYRSPKCSGYLFVRYLRGTPTQTFFEN